VATARIGDQLLTLTIPSSQACTASTTTLGATFTSTHIDGSREHLHYIRVAFSIERGVRHARRETIRKHGRRRTLTVITYRPNATLHASPATVELALGGLRSGIHTLTVTATYTETVGRRGRQRHEQIKTRTLHARFHVC